MPKLRALCSVKAGLVAVWIFLFWFFYALSSGITSSNDGSHFALTKSLYERGSAELVENKTLALHDSAIFNGKIYSDRNPGLSFISVVFLKLYDPLHPLVEGIEHDPRMKNRTANADRLVSTVMILPPLAGSLLFIVLFHLFIKRGLSALWSIGMALSIMLSTILLRYSTVFYSHIFSTLIVACSLVCFLDFFSQPRKFARLVCGTFLLASATVVEHPVLLLFAPVAVCLVYLIRVRSVISIGYRRLLMLALVMLLPLFPLFLYNHINFQNFLSIAHFHHSTVRAFRSASTFISLDALSYKTLALLFGRGSDFGLLETSPYFLLVVLLPLVYRRTFVWRIEHTFSFLCFVIALLPPILMPVHSGWDRDYRQFLFALPFLCLFFADFVRETLNRLRPTQRLLPLLLCLGFIVIFVSAFLMNLSHIRHSGQTRYTHQLINSWPAVINTAPIVAAVIALMIGNCVWLAIRRRPRTVDN